MRTRNWLTFQVVEAPPPAGATDQGPGPWYAVRFSDGEQVGAWRSRDRAVAFGEETCADDPGRVEMWRELQRLERVVAVARGALLRALDYNAVTVNGLAIKQAIREALAEMEREP